MTAGKRAVVERRKYIRLSAIARVEYGIVGEGGLPGSSSTKDMSRDGVRIACSEKLRKGTLLDLRIDTGDGAPVIVARVKTMWCKKLGEISGYDVGALFTAIQPADKEMLLDYAYRSWVKKTREEHRHRPD